MGEAARVESPRLPFPTAGPSRSLHRRVDVLAPQFELVAHVPPVEAISTRARVMSRRWGLGGRATMRSIVLVSTFGLVCACTTHGASDTDSCSQSIAQYCQHDLCPTWAQAQDAATWCSDAQSGPNGSGVQVAPGGCSLTYSCAAGAPDVPVDFDGTRSPCPSTALQCP